MFPAGSQVRMTPPTTRTCQRVAGRSVTRPVVHWDGPLHALVASSIAGRSWKTCGTVRSRGRLLAGSEARPGSEEEDRGGKKMNRCKQERSEARQREERLGDPIRKRDHRCPDEQTSSEREASTSKRQQCQGRKQHWNQECYREADGQPHPLYTMKDPGKVPAPDQMKRQKRRCDAKPDPDKGTYRCQPSPLDPPISEPRRASSLHEGLQTSRKSSLGIALTRLLALVPSATECPSKRTRQR